MLTGSYISEGFTRMGMTDRKERMTGFPCPPDDPPRRYLHEDLIWDDLVCISVRVTSHHEKGILGGGLDYKSSLSRFNGRFQYKRLMAQRESLLP